MKKLTLKLSTIALCIATAFSTSTMAEVGEQESTIQPTENELALSTQPTENELAVAAQPVKGEEKFHDADPRNSSFRGGIGVDKYGEMKLVTGGGFNGEFDEFNTQTNVIAEYFTQTENVRLRTIHFDSRVGGLYVDLNHIEDAMNISTVGYMIPLETIDKKTMLFPSVNYTYMNFDGINDAIDIHNLNQNTNAGAQALYNMGYASGTNNGVNAMGDGLENAHAASFSLYGLRAWDDTHYTVFQAAAGSTYAGQEAEFGNLLLIQGIRTKLGDNVLNIFVEAKYDHFAFKTGDDALDDKAQSGEGNISIGFDFRF